MGRLLAFLVVAPLAALIVHNGSSGSACGWNYAAVGGACRAIIIISVLGGLAAGGIAVAAAKALGEDDRRRCAILALVAVGVVVLAALGAHQFAEYRTGMSIR